MSALLVAADQLPEDVGKAGPMGLLLLALLAIAIVLLVKSMSRHLKRVPASFEAADQAQVVVPDDLAELDDDPPGSQLLDQLRRAPRAIEPPPANRRPDDAPGS